MNGFRNWFANFMMGRYGNDNLNRFLSYLTLALVVLNIFLHIRIIHTVIVLLLILIYCRMMSRNFPNRQRENMKFEELKAKFTGKGAHGYGQPSGYGRKGKDGAFKKDDGKRVLICPHCKEKLRVPVGAGKIKINCPHCRNTFEEIV